MAVLLANEEDVKTPGLDLFIDINAPCPMFFATPGPFGRHPEVPGDIRAEDLQKPPLSGPLAQRKL
jgi:hypothetical protein